jgi:hypothetical protein
VSDETSPLPQVDIPPKVLRIRSILVWVLWATIEQRNLLFLILSSLFIDGFLLSLVTGRCFGDSLKDVFAWSFGNGAYQPDTSWGEFFFLLIAGLLGYVLLGLILLQTSKAVAFAFNDEKLPKIGFIKWLWKRVEPD